MFCHFALSEKLPSGQGRQLEAEVLWHSCDSFHYRLKIHGTTYHPQHDGLVEWFNRTLLNMQYNTCSMEHPSDQNLYLCSYVWHTRAVCRVPQGALHLRIFSHVWLTTHCPHLQHEWRSAESQGQFICIWVSSENSLQRHMKRYDRTSAKINVTSLSNTITRFMVSLW